MCFLHIQVEKNLGLLSKNLIQLTVMAIPKLKSIYIPWGRCGDVLGKEKYPGLLGIIRCRFLIYPSPQKPKCHCGAPVRKKGFWKSGGKFSLGLFLTVQWDRHSIMWLFSQSQGCGSWSTTVSNWKVLLCSLAHTIRAIMLGWAKCKLLELPIPQHDSKSNDILHHWSLGKLKRLGPPSKTWNTQRWWFLLYPYLTFLSC